MDAVQHITSFTALFVLNAPNSKGYVGRTVQRLSERTGQHRRNLCSYTMLKDITNTLTNDNYRQDDEYSLGLHLIEDHGLN